MLADLDRARGDLFAAIGRLFATGNGLDGARVVGSLQAREAGLDRPGQERDSARTVKGRQRRAGVRPAQDPIAFDAPDARPVGNVFVLLVPEHATEQHLQLLSELAQMFSEKKFREALAAAADATALHDVFRTWKT